MKWGIILLAFIVSAGFTAESQWNDSLSHQGMISAWGGLNSDLSYPLRLGGRYIPQLNYSVFTTKNNKIDFEVSANLNGSLAIQPFDSVSGDAAIRAYRAWGRYSGQQFEIRAGLQKINFGSATLLRPLMWFDQLDPRDPLQLTNGVWSILGRYYFLNNANIWAWGLWGNKGPKTWESGATDRSFPELGGRFQHPLLNGEAAISYHYRQAEMNMADYYPSGKKEIPEHRIGADGKWDAGAGLWFEAVWIHKNDRHIQQTDQEILCAGIDYTFAFGNGLNALFEHLLYASDSSPFRLKTRYPFSALSLSYPIGLSNRLSVMLYRDWKNSEQYSFFSLQRQSDHFSFYLMAFLNPKNYYLPQQGTASRIFAGNGFQIMFVYNY